MKVEVTKTRKEKALEWVKTHKKELFIGGAAIICGCLGLKFSREHVLINWRKYGLSSREDIKDMLEIAEFTLYGAEYTYGIKCNGTIETKLADLGEIGREFIDIFNADPDSKVTGIILGTNEILEKLN